MLFDTSSKDKSLAVNAPTTRRSWYYDPLSMGLTTLVNNTKSEISIDGELKNASSVSLKPVAINEGRNFAKFRIEYCFEN
jgi:hypothetical protein